MRDIGGAICAGLFDSSAEPIFVAWLRASGFFLPIFGQFAEKNLSNPELYVSRKFTSGFE